jgi:hypothetical protein
MVRHCRFYTALDRIAIEGPAPGSYVSSVVTSMTMLPHLLRLVQPGCLLLRWTHAPRLLQLAIGDAGPNRKLTNWATC